MDGTARANIDYVAVPPAMLSFPAGQTPAPQMVTVTIDPEPALTAARSFTIDLFDPSGATIGNGVGTVTINPPAPPAVSIAPATVTASPGGTTDAPFVVTLSAPSAQPVSVAYATADGSARAGIDYVASAHTLTFTPGQTEQNITVAVDAAPQYAAPRTFAVNLSSPVGATTGTSQAIGTILNPNIPPQLSVSNAAVIASTSGSITATFTVSLSSPSTQAVTVDYATSDGTATAGVNYVAIPTTLLTFTPGQTEQSVMVTVDSEAATASVASFAVRLSNPTGAAIAGSAAVGVGEILAPGNFPAVSIGAGNVIPSTSQATTATFAVSLSAAFAQAATVSYATSNGTAEAGVD
jgi:chitinase